jgi:hypothetical protein
MRIKYTRDEPVHTVMGLDFTIIAPLARQGVLTVGDLIDTMPLIDKGEVPGIGRKRAETLKEFVQNNVEAKG